jgi:Contractile injection system tube protein
MSLEKAIITELDGDREIDEFPVQFNPTSLRLTLANRVEGGDTRGKEVRQNLGPSSTTLSMDLVFDTADEGTTESPVSVREKTKRLERFLVPRGTGQQQGAPPQVKFAWGDLIIIGVVESLTVDLDHFAANGAPLRAKVSLSIKGQDRDKELTSISDNRQGAPAPGNARGGGLGAVGGSLGLGLSVSASIGLGLSANIGVALDGESAGQFAARMGVDPAAWRGLDLGVESSLSLSAGVEIGFNANLTASAGLGVTVGVEAGVSGSIESSFGLTSTGGNAVNGAGGGAELAAGFALSSAGGVGAALEAVKVAKIEQAEQQTRAAFKTPPKPTPLVQANSVSSRNATYTSAQPKQPEQKHTPLVRTGLPTVSAQLAAPTAPRLPRADARASSFGFGVPLRPSVGEAADRRAETINGDVAVKPKVVTGDPPTTNDPTKPAWVALPVRNGARRDADKAQRKIRPVRPCGCSGGCGH